MRSILLTDQPARAAQVFTDAMRDRLAFQADMCPETVTGADLKADPDRFREVEFVFSTWGMPTLSEEEIAALLPRLKAVFYAAGSVQYFARPFLKRGIRVFSAWAANAVPVAEYTLAQILLSNKLFFLQSRNAKARDGEAVRTANRATEGNYDRAVGLIGAGMIGSMVAEKLKDYALTVKVFDPFLSPEKAAALGVTLCSLEELFASCGVVSNHLANNPQTVGMLTGKLFASMPPYATFLNTGRGAQVVEAELAQVLAQRPDLTAVLDVTDPEPSPEGHPFYTLPNCVLTPHIAGSMGNETHRMAEYMAEEFVAFAAGTPGRWEVTEDMLATMA